TLSSQCFSIDAAVQNWSQHIPAQIIYARPSSATQYSPGPTCGPRRGQLLILETLPPALEDAPRCSGSNVPASVVPAKNAPANKTAKDAPAKKTAAKK